MSQEEEDDDDGFFQEIYSQGYTGPLQREKQRAPSPPPAAAPKRKAEDSDSEGERARDPHEVPTEFTSREGKFWDAKAKALERAWKRKKEEELLCRICGEAGHFSQVALVAGRHRGGEGPQQPVMLSPRQLLAPV